MASGAISPWGSPGGRPSSHGPGPEKHAQKPFFGNSPQRGGKANPFAGGYHGRARDTSNRSETSTVGDVYGAGIKEEEYMLLTYLRARMQREEGQALVEYALILSLIAVVAIGILVIMGGRVANIFTQITTQL
jgi:pilus assembly protein Flp/PilA